MQDPVAAAENAEDEGASPHETHDGDDKVTVVDEAEKPDAQVLGEEDVKGRRCDESMDIVCEDRAVEDEEMENPYAKWMRHSFGPHNLAAIADLRSHPPQPLSADESSHHRLCDECNKRTALLVCADCALSLCFTCTDAIHIIEALATHAIAWTTQADTIANGDATRDPPPPPVTQLLTPLPNMVDFSLAPSMRHLHPPTQVEHRLHLPIGTKLFFRADDCGRWARELLHGSVIGLDHGVRSNNAASNQSSNAGSDLSFFYRVLWLRGVEALANGFFRANLLLPAPCWPVEIGLFPSQLSAFRAVLTAERLARSMLRRERVSGRWHDHSHSHSHMHSHDATSPTVFPSIDIVNEILDETDAILGHEFRTRLTQQDDIAFLTAVGTGTWHYDAWVKGIGRENDLREEAVANQELDDALRTIGRTTFVELLLLWSPRGRLRFFLLEQHELLLPAPVQHAHVALIIRQMLFVYMGFAWHRWRKFTARHRRYELKQRRAVAASRISQWWRRQYEMNQQRVRLEQAMAASPLDALTLFHKRQAQAAKLYAFMIKQYTAKQRFALQRWAQATISSDEDRSTLAAREAATAAAAHGEWHPSHGMASLPRLPSMYAHRKLDGSVGIDNLALYKQFRANHAGPTEASYWVVRHRVLMGVYPIGPAFRDARRMVSRADSTTSVLLERINTFVCLAEPEELEQHERTVDTSCLVQLQQQKQQQQQSKQRASEDGSVPMLLPCQTPWLWERIVRAKHELLRGELAGAIKLSERHVTLAQRDLDDWLAAPSIDTDDARTTRETLVNKLALAQQSVRKAHETLAQLPPLEFVQFPIAKDNVPADTNAFERFLRGLEDRLRRDERLYIFSMQGHGRTGLLAALLLGRLYGLTATDALERAQRLHDCQPALHGARAAQGVSSPHAASQIGMATQLLAHYNDAVYARVISENSDQQFVQWRAQQRGLALDKAATRDGFLVSDRVDEVTQHAQQQEVKTLRRVAKRESMAMKLQAARRREAQERQIMGMEEEGIRPTVSLMSLTVPALQARPMQVAVELEVEYQGIY